MNLGAEFFEEGAFEPQHAVVPVELALPVSQWKSSLKPLSVPASQSPLEAVGKKLGRASRRILIEIM
jgi:hypothetical protein